MVGSHGRGERSEQAPGFEQMMNIAPEGQRNASISVTPTEVRINLTFDSRGFASLHPWLLGATLKRNFKLASGRQWWTHYCIAMLSLTCIALCYTLHSEVWYAKNETTQERNHWLTDGKARWREQSHP